MKLVTYFCSIYSYQFYINFKILKSSFNANFFQDNDLDNSDFLLKLEPV